ncbi:MAG: hypothetical protein M1503_04340 [Thaumarchaeota archaeon]|nr:hypothetical protein [Nitrososphaerota archaeon]MCL5317480.1 hypothetical protein [Nitrososphaerota archaeon]
MGWKPSVSYPFLGLMRLTGQTRRVKINGKTFVIRDYRFKPIRAVWPYILLVDYVVNCVVRVRLARLSGEHLVCDRYAYDFLAQLYEEKMCPSILHRLALKLFPLPSISFLFDVHEHTSWERSMAGERTFEQPLYNFTARRKIYLQLAQQYGMKIVDSQLSPDQMVNEILRTLPVAMDGTAPPADTTTSPLRLTR